MSCLGLAGPAWYADIYYKKMDFKASIAIKTDIFLSMKFLSEWKFPTELKVAPFDAYEIFISVSPIRIFFLINQILFSVYQVTCQYLINYTSNYICLYFLFINHENNFEISSR